jgi:hypothetical protein
MFLEMMTLAIIVFVLAVKWVTTKHKSSLRQRLIVADVNRTRNEQRYKLFQKEHQAAQAEEAGAKRDLEMLTSHLKDQQEELEDQEERNRELREQIEE